MPAFTSLRAVSISSRSHCCFAVCLLALLLGALLPFRPVLVASLPATTTMAANNNAGGAGGRQAGGNQMNEHVEFSVKAEEDLYLQGSETTIRRVTAETNYSCLMLKTQRFSSLFRHYAKYHGLRKDDLEYYFVNLLENEDTPETVQLQRGDTIMVRRSCFFILNY